MRILTLTSLWPDSTRPNHGIFVENRMRRVHETGEAEVTVVAPVPWFPVPHPAFGTWGRLAAVPRRETRHGIRVEHPRYAMIPKLGMSAQPALYLAAARRAVRRLIEETGPFDVIDAHYFYPDGVAAVRLGAELGIPVAVSARGSDVSLIPTVSSHARRAIGETARAADACIGVCEALRLGLVGMGADPSRSFTLRNGVDLDGFRPPKDRAALRARWGVPYGVPLAVSVGGLVALKGHDLTIAAIAETPGAHLRIAGEGPERARLEALIADRRLEARVELLGALPHADLPDLFGAADLSILASSREGWANVLLESMACGTPALATDVWGTREVVAAPEAGRLVRDRSIDGLKQGMVALLADPPAREAVRAYAESFSWDETVRGVLDVLRGCIERRARRTA